MAEPNIIPENQVHAHNLKLPPFWPNSLSTWFIQIESQFAIARIVSETTKYNYVVSSLPQEVAESLADVLGRPPVENAYTHLKTTLISRHSLSIECRIKKLISHEDMGDRKPSEYFRKLRQLAGSCETVGDELIKKIWISRLPNLINIALIPQRDQEFDIILDTADKIWDAMQASGSGSVSSLNHTDHFSSQSSTSSKYDILEKELHELKRMISTLSFGNNFKSRSRQRSISRGRTPNQSHSKQRSDICWYHLKFGEKAAKCKLPCQYNSSFVISNQQKLN